MTDYEAASIWLILTWLGAVAATLFIFFAR